MVSGEYFSSGLDLDSHLNWKHHVLRISKKVSRCIGIMCKLRQFVNSNMLKNIYYSLLYPHLVYAIQVWGSASANEMNKILVLQKRALRIITYNDALPLVPGPLHPSDPLFYKVDILKVMIFSSFRLLNLSLIVYSLLHQLFFTIGLP